MFNKKKMVVLSSMSNEYHNFYSEGGTRYIESHGMSAPKLGQDAYETHVMYLQVQS